jgi:two-component system, NarL family, response regulator NreC
MKPLKVILVDDNEMFREAFKTLLESQYHATIIGEASNAAEFLALNVHSKTDIIFMDIMMPEIDGITATKNALCKNDGLLVVAVTMHNDTVYLRSLIEAGFVGCIFKNNLFAELPLALETILNGKRYFPKNILLDETL